MKKQTTIIAVTLFIVGMLSVSINFGSDRSEGASFLTTTTTAAIPTIGERPTTFFACTARDDAKWTYSANYSTVRCLKQNFLGPYGHAATVRSPTFKTPEHRGIIVSFKLLFGDSWENEVFKFTADGKEVFTATWSVANSKSETCGNRDFDDELKTVTFGFNHTGETVTFDLASTLKKDKDNEFWALCDFTVRTTRDPVTAAGVRLPTLGDSTSLFFSSADMINDETWTYPGKFNTITCDRTNYLGPYGAGAKLVSPKFFVEPSHQGVIVSVKVAFLDSWDDEWFRVFADGREVHATQWNGGKSKSNVCHAGYNDDFKEIKFGFNHDAKFIQFTVDSTLNQGAEDESWGITDFTVRFSETIVTPAGLPINTADLKDKVLYFPCGAPANTGIWAYNQGYQTIRCNSGTFLAYGAGGKALSPTFNVAAHQALVVSFRLALIDSWDGEEFTVKADGKSIYSYKWNTAQSPSNTCQGAWNDAYTTVTIGLNHVAPTVQFEFSSTVDQESADEAWGVCDFTVVVSQTQVTPAGVPTNTAEIKDKITYFPCNAAGISGVWTYNHYPTQVNCTNANKRIYSTFGAGAIVTSPKFSTAAYHQGVIVSFKLGHIDSWDGENFLVKVDGRDVYKSTWSVHSATANFCATGWNDHEKDVTFGFNHEADSLQLVLTSTLDQAVDDESWGVCDLTITLSHNIVTPEGIPVTTAELKDKLTFFACGNPTNPGTWTYSKGFSTVKCQNGNFAKFGAEGVATTPKISIGAHQGLIVSFRLTQLASWENETFYVKADGVEIYKSTWHMNSAKANTCGTNWAAGTNEVVIGLNHTNSTVQFEFSSNLNKNKDKSWGICDFTVQTTQVKVAADGRVIQTIDGSAKFFACANQPREVQWKYAAGSDVIKCNGNSYIRYAKDGSLTSHTFAVAGVHKGVLVSFKLAHIDSWDSELFIVKAEGNQVFTSTWNVVTQAAGKSNACGAGWVDSFTDVVFGFNHTADTLSFVISSTIDQDMGDESWGICDFVVQTTQVPVAASGRLVRTLNAAGERFFPCGNLAQNDYFQYPAQKYSAVKCDMTESGVTYTGSFLGSYGKGESVASYPFLVGNHTNVTVSFKLAFLDSWDGEAFLVHANGLIVYTTTWTVLGHSKCGQGHFGDGFKDVEFTFPHTANELTLTFGSTLDQPSEDEGWGICNLNVKAN